MNTNGVMEEIRSLLSEGWSATETIALGYKASTVYKAQRQLRRSPSVSVPPVTTQVLVTNMASVDWTRLREENNSLRENLSSLEDVTAERDSLGQELDLALSQVEELTVEASQAQMLQDRLTETELAVAKAADLRREVQDLQSHCRNAAFHRNQFAIVDYRGRPGINPDSPPVWRSSIMPDDSTMNAKELMGEWLSLGDIPILLGDVEETLSANGVLI